MDANLCEKKGYRNTTAFQLRIFDILALYVRLALARPEPRLFPWLLPVCDAFSEEISFLLYKRRLGGRGGGTRRNEKAAECEGNACVLARLKLMSNNQPRLLFLAVVWFSFVGSTKTLGGPGSLREIIYNSLAWERVVGFFFSLFFLFASSADVLV